MANRGKQLAALVTACALLTGQVGAPIVSAAADEREAQSDSRRHHGDTESPIKHVIVIVGENRTFDHIFGTYQPKHGQKILNLLSQGIVKADGTPGANFDRARQFSVPPQATYFIASNDKTPYAILPTPTLGGAPNVQSNPFLPITPTNPGLPPFALPLPVLAALAGGGVFMILLDRFGTRGERTIEDLDWRGLDFSKEDFDRVMSIDKELWKNEILSHEELFIKLYDRLPKELRSVRDLLMSSLWRSSEHWEL